MRNTTPQSNIDLLDREPGDPESPAEDWSSGLAFRTEVLDRDVAAIAALAEAAKVFSPEEINLAAELVSERLSRGEASGYYFLFAEADGQLAGYTCFGPAPCTRYSYDLYWIIVSKNFVRRGVGRRLLAGTEETIARQGGRRIYVDTSSRPAYEPARGFYRTNGYRLEAMIRCFYAPDDHKMLYLKTLPAASFGR